jgi:hypothetical protein
MSAADHHDEASKHHRQAAKHFESGDDEKGGHHGHAARGHAAKAMHHGDEAAMEHAASHGRKK